MSHFPADENHCDRHRLHRLPCPKCPEERRDDWLQTGFPSEEDWREAYQQVVRERDEARKEVEEWKRFRASQIDQEARNAIDYSIVCRDRDEAREAMRRLMGDCVGQVSEKRLQTYRQQFPWLRERG